MFNSEPHHGLKNFADIMLAQGKCLYLAKDTKAIWEEGDRLEQPAMPAPARQLLLRLDPHGDAV
jgi:hypothetical protein